MVKGVVVRPSKPFFDVCAAGAMAMGANAKVDFMQTDATIRLT
jgi:hypothetical protein